MNLRAKLFGTLIALLFSWSAFATGIINFDIKLPVKVRDGVFVKTNVNIKINGSNPFHGKKIMGIHGLAHTSNTFGPWADRMFSQFGSDISVVMTMDLPGRNGSSLPFGPTTLLFGDMTLGDYVKVIRGTLKSLKLIGFGPDIIAAHSMGSLLTQMVQTELMGESKSLRSEYGVKSALLFASSIPGNVPWYVADQGIAAGLAAPYLTSTTELGLHLDVPSAVWIAFFFGNLSGQFGPGTPTVTDVDNNGYNAKEASLALLELVGAAPFTRPLVNADSFTSSTGTELIMASFQEDAFAIYDSEHKALYEHLTGDNTYANFVGVTGQYAVHDDYISAPADMDAALSAAISAAQ